ncbi:MAG TPA: hypothetical protein VGL29_07975 [Blastocatellia bacterium]|jgi:hypothetical protein
MSFTNRLPARQRLFVVLSVVLGTVLLSSALLSPTRAGKQKDISVPVVKDNTGSLRLVSLEKVEDLFVIRLKNTSDKVITAHGQAVCDVPWSSTDYSIGDHPIQPGAVFEIAISARGLSEMCGSTKAEPAITILAVIFADRSYAGEFQWAKGILDDRRGQKMQLKRINRLLSQALKWPDVGEPTAIDKVKSEVDLLPIDEGEAPAVRGGLSTAKQRVSYLLEELKQWHQNSLTAKPAQNVPLRGELFGIKSVHEGISRLISLSEKWISRY